MPRSDATRIQPESLPHAANRLVSKPGLRAIEGDRRVCILGLGQAVDHGRAQIGEAALLQVATGRPRSMDR